MFYENGTLRAWLAIVCVVGASSVAQSQETAAETANVSLAGQIASLGQPYIDANITVGLSIGVAKGDETCTIHLGEATEAKSPSDKTVYEIGSISKVFTGVLLADAVDSGLLKLDQPAQDLLPEGVKMPIRDGKPIRLIHMSTHASGLPRMPNNMEVTDGLNPYKDYSSKLAYEFLAKHELERAPGEKAEYSNFAASLLGKLVCEKHSLTYDELLRKKITDPLGMTSTAVTLTPAMKKRFAQPYVDPDAPGKGWDFGDLPGSGGIRSTIPDMLKFARANLKPEGVLKGAIDLAWKEHSDLDNQKMGLGWHFAGDGITRWHNGQTGGFHSMLMVNREEDIAVVVLANTATMEIDQLAGDIVRLLAGETVASRVFPADVEVPKEVMQRYIGRYRLAPGIEFTVSVKNAKLMVGLTGQETFRVYAKSETEWFYKVVDAELTFKVDEDGTCSEVELFQNGVRQTAPRMEDN